MTPPYGKIRRKGTHKPTPPPAEVQINITGRHTLEQISLELQRAIGRLQEYDVIGVQNFRMRFEPLDEKGEAMALWDAGGKPIEKIQIPEEQTPPPYRK